MENYEYVLLISKNIKVFTLKSIAIILKLMTLIYFVLYYKSIKLTLIKLMVIIYLISHYLSLYYSKAPWKS